MDGDLIVIESAVVPVSALRAFNTHDFQFIVMKRGFRLGSMSPLNQRVIAGHVSLFRVPCSIRFSIFVRKESIGFPVDNLTPCTSNAIGVDRRVGRSIR